MSKAITELGGKVVEGLVTVRDAGLRGMITLRGDLSNAALQEVCSKITGVAFPAMGQAQADGQSGLAWMSPDEVLVFVPYDTAREAVSQIDAALAGQHYLAVNVSDARTVIFVEGRGAREIMAKLAPVDLHPESFGPGQFRRSRLGQVAAAFWMRDDATFEVICFRSVGDYCFSLLATSASDGVVGIF